MATTLSLSTNYAGIAAKDYIAALLLAGDTLGNELITIKSNVNFKMDVQKISLTNITKKDQASWSPSGTVTIVPRTIEPVRLEAQFELNKHSFLSSWESDQMGYGSNKNLPSTVQDAIIVEAAKYINAETEYNIWNGVGTTGTTATFDGFTTLFATDATINKITGSTMLFGVTGVTAVTPDNVTAYLSKGIEKLGLLKLKTPVLYVSADVYQSYILSLGGVATMGYLNQGQNQTFGELVFAGVPVKKVGLETGKAVLAEKANLWFGTDLTSNLNNLGIKDMGEFGETNIRFFAKYSGSVQYGIGAEIIYMSI